MKKEKNPRAGYRVWMKSAGNKLWQVDGRKLEEEKENLKIHVSDRVSSCRGIRLRFPILKFYHMNRINNNLNAVPSQENWNSRKAISNPQTSNLQPPKTNETKVLPLPPPPSAPLVSHGIFANLREKKFLFFDFHPHLLFFFSSSFWTFLLVLLFFALFCNFFVFYFFLRW